MTPPSNGGRATLKDVANLAGVHPGTASRAINAETRPLVNAETARRVRPSLGTGLDWARAAGARGGIKSVDGVEEGLARQSGQPKQFSAPPSQEIPRPMTQVAAMQGKGGVAAQVGLGGETELQRLHRGAVDRPALAGERALLAVRIRVVAAMVLLPFGPQDAVAAGFRGEVAALVCKAGHDLARRQALEGLAVAGVQHGPALHLGQLVARRWARRRRLGRSGARACWDRGGPQPIAVPSRLQPGDSATAGRARPIHIGEWRFPR